MPGKTQQDKKQTVPEGGGGELLDADVAELLGVLCEFARGDNFQSLSSKLREMNALRQERDNVRLAYHTNLATLSGMKEELEAKDVQHAKALDAYQKESDSAVAAKERAEADAETLQKSVAEKASQVKELEARFEKLILDNKAKEKRIHALEETERQRDVLRSDLATAKAELDTQAKDLQEASDGLALIRSFVVPLDTVRGDRDSM
jgi:DNA repair exonuclease SbcCD ATPase subunit